MNTTATHHRVNADTVAKVTSGYAFIIQSDPIDYAATHTVHLTVEELRALLAAVETA